MTVEQSASHPLVLFYSYAHDDEPMRVRLEQHLSALRSSGIIRDWHDRKIVPGAQWDDAIRRILESSDVILLLISASFLSSSYINSVELEEARRLATTRNRRLIPVILRDCPWDQLLWLKDFQALPKDARPVTRWRPYDRAFTDIVRGIREAADELRSLDPERQGKTGDVRSSVKSANAIANLPEGRNANFVGREDVLAKLSNGLPVGTGAEAVVTGPAGTGKTQLALEFAYRHRADYDVIWWIRAEEPHSILAGFADLGDTLRRANDSSFGGEPARTRPAIADATKRSNDATIAQRWLSEHDRWLLVFDNVEQPEDLTKYRDDLTRGHVLITSRKGQWSERASVLTLTPLSGDQSAAYLKTRTGLESTGVARALAERLGGLPLALEQAAAYIETTDPTNRDVERYTRLIASKALSPGRGRADDTPVTLGLSLERVHRQSEEAADVLYTCAFLAPEAIPRSIFSAATRVRGSVHAPSARVTPFDHVIAILSQFSLVTVRGDTLSVHRLVQQAIRARLTSRQLRAWSKIALRLVNEAFPEESEDPSTWPECVRLVPHAIAVVDHAEQHAPTEPSIPRLLNRVAAYYDARAQFAEGQATASRALAHTRRILGPGDVEIARSHAILGNIHDSLDKLDIAKRHYETALRIYRQRKGERSEAVADQTSNVGYVVWRQGDDVAAERRFKKALSIDQALFGARSARLAPTLVNLATIYAERGEPDRARPLFEQALAIDEEVNGPSDTTVAEDLSALGLFVLDQGDVAKALQYLERAREITEAKYPPMHPAIAAALTSLARAQRDAAQFLDARRSCERAIEINEKVFGKVHSEVAAAYFDLATVLHEAGDLDEALGAFRAALEIESVFYGPDHYEVGEDWFAVAEVLRDQERWREARDAYDKALAILRAEYGEKDERVGDTLYGMARVARATGKKRQACELLVRALTSYRAAYGASHEETRVVLQEIADLGCSTTSSQRTATRKPRRGR